MRYTQSQVRELVGLPLQTYRYWAALIPHLSSRGGKGSVFTTGDLLGLALMQEACTGVGLAVGNVCDGLDQMFGILTRIIHEKCAIKAKSLTSFATMRTGCLMEFFAMKSLAQAFGGLGRFRAI